MILAVILALSPFALALVPASPLPSWCLAFAFSLVPASPLPLPLVPWMVIFSRSGAGSSAKTAPSTTRCPTSARAMRILVGCASAGRTLSLSLSPTKRFLTDPPHRSQHLTCLPALPITTYLYRCSCVGLQACAATLRLKPHNLAVLS